MGDEKEPRELTEAEKAEKRERRERRKRRDSEAGDRKKSDSGSSSRRKERDEKDGKERRERKEGSRTDKDRERSRREPRSGDKESRSDKDRERRSDKDKERKKRSEKSDKADAAAPDTPTQRTLQPIVRSEADMVADIASKEKKKKRSFFGIGKKKNKAMEIGGVISFAHEGHAGFDAQKGGLKTEGLPPALQEFFTKLDETMRQLGFEGVTQKEMQLVLKKYGHLLIDIPPPGAAGKKEISQPVVDEKPKPKTMEEWRNLANNQEVQLTGMKSVLNTLQDSKSKMQTQVQELEATLATERKASQEMLAVNTNLEIELAKCRERLGDKADTGTGGSSALQKLENVMRNRLEEANGALEKERGTTASLHQELQAASDERDTLQKELDQYKEILRQYTDGSAPAPAPPTAGPPTGMAPPPPPPAGGPPPPPPAAPAPPPMAPGMPPPPKSSGGGGGGGGGALAGIGSVQLRKTEAAPAKAVDSRDSLLASIQAGAKLKKVEATERPAPVESDDGNVLNLIAKALIDRRARIKEGDGSDEEDWPDNEDEWSD